MSIVYNVRVFIKFVCLLCEPVFQRDFALLRVPCNHDKEANAAQKECFGMGGKMPCACSNHILTHFGNDAFHYRLSSFHIRCTKLVNSSE